MGTPTDPTFGSDFDASAFRSAIISTMEMGMANGDDVATFYWDSISEYDYGSEEYRYGDGRETVPYDLTDTPETAIVRAKRVTVPVAVEFISRATSSAGLPMGDIQEPRVIITILDTWYDEIKTADGVEFSGTKYTIDYHAPVTGLFDVNVYEIYASATDEA